MSAHHDPLAPAMHTAHVWLKSIAENLGTDDHAFTHRAIRAWLHSVRDRLGVNASAHLSAQLPELLRGIFYEGWIPAHVPVPHDVPSFLSQFAHESGVSPDEAAALAGAVTDGFAQLFSPGQLDHVLAQLPTALRQVLLGVDLAGVLAAAAVFTPGEAERVEELEIRLRALGEAVAVLTRGLEDLPGSAGDEAARAAAAQRAHRILLAEGLTSPTA